MRIAGHDIAVCDWSLRAGDAAATVQLLGSMGLSWMQLGLGRLLEMDEASRQEEIAVLGRAGIGITAGMIGFAGEDYSTIAMIRQTGGFVPDELWEQRQQLTIRAGRLAREIRVGMLSTHVGFIPPSNHQKYPAIVSRVAEVARRLGEMDVMLLMETGQEKAEELLQFLNDVPASNVKINFDPANMILYGAGDPIEAVRILGRHIRHVHVKDAKLSDQPGVKWGEEVPFGTGQVNAKALLRVLAEVGYDGPLAIEREAGDDRAGDVQQAIAALRAAAEGG